MMATPKDGEKAIDVPRFLILAGGAYGGGFGYGASLKEASEKCKKAMGAKEWRKAKKLAYLIPDGIREVFIDNMGGLNWEIIDLGPEAEKIVARPIKLGEIL